MLEALKSAQSRVDLALFHLSHEALINALCHLSAERGIAVRLIVDIAATTPADRHLLDCLGRYGVRIFALRLSNGKMHLKAAVIDEDIVITGAANWTPQAMDLSVEDSLIIRSVSIARRYRKRMDDLVSRSEPCWDENTEGIPKERPAFPDASAHSSGAGNGWVSSLACAQCLERASVFFPPQDRARDALERSIQAATSSVDVAMYILSDNRLCAALKRKAEAGIPVRLLVDAGMLDTSTRPLLQDLADSGIEVAWWKRERSSMHLKVAILDRRAVWTGSANWTGGGLDNNVEDMLSLDSDIVAKRYAGFLDALHAQAEPFVGIGAAPRMAPPVLSSARGFVEGLPPTGPRTNWIGGLDDTPFPAFDVLASVQYVPDEAYYPALVKLIDGAKQSLLISMYVFPRLKEGEKLKADVVKRLSAAARRGVYVYMLLNTPGQEGASAAIDHEEWAAILRERGIDVRLNTPAVPLHDKLVVADLSKILIGSHNWTEGALSADRVREASVLLVLSQPDPRFADYVFSREVVRDMRSRECRQEELRRLRHIAALPANRRNDFTDKLQEMDAP